MTEGMKRKVGRLESARCPLHACVVTEEGAKSLTLGLCDDVLDSLSQSQLACMCARN